jgi:uncharacterized protein
MLKKQYKILADFYFQNISKGKKIYYSPFDERIKTWAQRPYKKGDLCDLANSQIAIAPSGRIYPCVQFIGSDNDSYLLNSIGDIEKGFLKEKREEFTALNYKDKKSCAGCAFCGCVNWRATGKVDVIPPIICEHEHILMPIADILAGHLWKKRIPLFKRKFYEKTFPISSYIEDCVIKKWR